MNLKTCSYCHKEKTTNEFNRWCRSNDGLQPWCRACQKTERELHKSHYAKRHAQYYQEHKSELNKAGREWAKANPEKRKAIQLKSRINNLERYREIARAQYRKHYENNREKLYARNRDRRAKKKAAEGKISVDEWQARLVEFAFCCAYCLKQLGKDITMDHMIPLVKSGTHTIDNVVPACRSCNSQKQRRSILEWFVSKRKIDLAIS